MNTTFVCQGLLSELCLVRMHGRAAEYLAAPADARAAIAAACRREATVPDLPERILARTIYAQASSRVGPLRELLQNALDASPRGSRIDVRLSDDGSMLFVRDRGRGMTEEELLSDLLVPFRSAKQGEPNSIGEHGIGFFSALELAPDLEVTTSTATEAHALRIRPLGEGPPFADFGWSLSRVSPAALAAAARPNDKRTAGRVTGTVIRLKLSRPVTLATLVAEVTQAVRLVDPYVARIFVNDVLANTARAQMRRVARAGVESRGAALGEVCLYLGRGQGVEPEYAVTQGGLLVTLRQDTFAGAELSLHRDLLRAIVAAGYGLVVELPPAVPLNKGRSAVAASSSAAVDRAIVQAFERFVLEDALYNRELLRAVDHRLSTVLDRVVASAVAGEALPPAAPPELDDRPPASGRRPSAAVHEAQPGVARTPTVAAPEEVVRFAAALVEAPAFQVTLFDEAGRELRHRVALRDLLASHKAGLLRRYGEGREPGVVYLLATDPLAEALWRRLAPPATADAAFSPAAEQARAQAAPRLARITRSALLAGARGLRGVESLAAAMTIVERIDLAISQAANLPPSPISVHQALYGPDEMAHTDGNGISLNLASRRVRALFCAVLTTDDVMAFSALSDLLLHEKTHVSLASYVPRATAEHGATFYRRKDQLRRRLLDGLSSGKIADPMSWLPSARQAITVVELPSLETLSEAFQSDESEAA